MSKSELTATDIADILAAAEQVNAATNEWAHHMQKHMLKFAETVNDVLKHRKPASSGTVDVKELANVIWAWTKDSHACEHNQRSPSQWLCADCLAEWIVRSRAMLDADAVWQQGYDRGYKEAEYTDHG